MAQTPEPSRLLVARPIDEAVICRIESQTEVASSAAFQSIDDQYYAGKLTSTEVAVYKARYMKLHEALKKTRDNEFNLIQLSKRYMGEIEEQEQELARADQFPDNAITEPSQMRAQILNYYNTAMETDERVEMLHYEAQLLKEERKLLNRDYSRLPTAELEAMDDDVDIFTEMERRMKLVQNQCQDLWLQIDMIKMEAKRSREQLRQASDMEHEALSELANLNNKMSDVKAEWVIAADLPGQYSKEAEKARKYKSNAEKDLQNLQQEFAELSETLANLEMRVREIEAEERADREDLQAKRLTTVDKKQSLDKTVKMHESWYEMEMMNRTEKARYLQRIHIAEQDKKDSSEELAKITRERDTHMRHCKKVQTQIEMLNDSVRVVRLLHDKARARYIVTPRYDGEMLARKRRLARAIEHLQQDLEDEQKRTASEVAHLSRTVGAAERRLALMEYLRAENWELIRLTTSLSEGLSKAISEYTSARLRHERLMEDLTTKTKELQEGQKVLDELGAKLADVSALYSKMKLERNKCVSLLQASVKLALDTRERLRIHMNEAEIIIFRLQRHDQELARERSLYSSAIVQRDHKRNELCKMVHLHAEQLARREQMRRSIHCINCIFNQTEAETLSVKKAKERSAQIRNERAILLIERNQEVYILQQRIDAQDLAGRAAQQTLSTLDEEQECLNRYRNHLVRYIDVVRNTLPTHKKLTAELQGLTHQLIGSRMELTRLMEMAEDPDVPGRLRLLGGKDPSQHELWITLGRLERRMAAKEEDMAEKNLTYEAVCRLVDGLQVRVTAGKDDTLTLAMEVNKVKDRLQQLRNYMKTMYAELVVCGAERNTLKEQVINLERGLDIYSLRMRYGFPPSAGLEQKWHANMQLAKIRKAGKFDCPSKIQPMRPPGTKPSRLEDPRQSPLDILQWRWTGAVNVNNQRGIDFECQKRQFNRSNRLASDLSAEINVHRPYRSMRLPPILDRSNRQSLSQRRPDQHSTELHRRHPLQEAVQVRSLEKRPYSAQVTRLRSRDRIRHLVSTRVRPTRTIRPASISNRQRSTEIVNGDFNPNTPQLSLIQSDEDSVSLVIDGDNNDEPQEGGKLNRPSLEHQVEESVLTWTEENDMITFEPERPGTNSVQCSSDTESAAN